MGRQHLAAVLTKKRDPRHETTRAIGALYTEKNNRDRKMELAYALTSVAALIVAFFTSFTAFDSPLDCLRWATSIAVAVIAYIGMSKYNKRKGLWESSNTK